PGDIADSVEVLVKAVQRSEAGPRGAEPAVIVVAPPPMQEVDWLADMFRGGAEKSLRLPDLMRDAARRSGAGFVDAGAFVESSSVDGIHLDSDSHRVLGLELARATAAALDGVSGERKLGAPA